MNTYHIFFDESGDLGFDFTKSKTTRWFLVTFLMCESKRPVEKVVSSTFNALRKSSQKNRGGILHAVSEKDSTRRRMLEGLSKKDIKVFVLRIDKKSAFFASEQREHVLYAFYVNMLLKNVMSELDNSGCKLKFIASSKHTNRYYNEAFLSLLSVTGEKLGADLEVVLRKPSQEKGLQAVDFVSWSLFQDCERGIDHYKNMIRDKIVYDEELFG
ncbi:MAG: DUF3800 domain-containing protein [Coriobacteriia bacterium]|nr:DUF3800 domain-containing protein [Coriobacteriia bacterium]